MGPTGNRSTDHAAGPTTDPEFVAALLAVHRRLHLKDQLGELIRAAVAWSGAAEGFALAPDEDQRTLGAVASTVDAADPRLEALRGIDLQPLKRALRGPARVFDGLGPFAGTPEPWSGDPPAACAALPVSAPNGDWGGVLCLLFAERPDESVLDRFQTLLDEVAPAVENALQVASMRELVIKDDTAHCFNRRYFESCLPEELSRANRFHAPLSLIFLDMDNLKEVNNRFGHAMGSRTLFEVSRRIRSKIRRFDKLFRFGGDEFCIVLPETEWHGALEVAERVRDAIASKPFLEQKVDDPKGIRMTASLGIASFPLHARTQAELIELADRAMQRIKSGTKNSIGIAEIVEKNMAGDRRDSRELRLEGFGLLLIGGLLLAVVVGAFYLGRWVERRSLPPASAVGDGVDPLGPVLGSEEPFADVEADLTFFDAPPDEGRLEPGREVPDEPSKPAEPAAPAPATGPATGFFVQVFVGRDRQSVETIVGKLRAEGYPVRLVTEAEGGGQLFKVRVGAYPTQDRAREIVQQLKTVGYADAFVKRVD